MNKIEIQGTDKLDQMKRHERTNRHVEEVTKNLMKNSEWKNQVPSEEVQREATGRLENWSSEELRM